MGDIVMPRPCTSAKAMTASYEIEINAPLSAVKSHAECAGNALPRRKTAHV